jgi:hypothetical protein
VKADQAMHSQYQAGKGYSGWEVDQVVIAEQDCARAHGEIDWQE